jgi:uncharacterized membrane protein YhfC
MSETLALNSGFVIATAFSIVFVIVYPIVLAVVARRKLRLGWRYVAYGAIVFFVFQLVTRVPAVQLIQSAIGPQLEASPVLTWTWLVALALSAGVFEEVGRYVGYRFLMRREDKTWSKAVMFGIGHGGLESALLVGGLMVLALISLWAAANGGLNQLPDDQRAAATQQLQALNAQPGWAALFGAWERLWTVPIQIAFSVLVLQVFRRGQLVWLVWAILGHAFVDLAAVGLQQILGQGLTTSVLIEAVVAVFGLMALWIIWRLRDPPVQAVSSVAPSSLAQTARLARVP